MDSKKGSGKEKWLARSNATKYVMSIATPDQSRARLGDASCGGDAVLAVSLIIS